MLVIFDLFERRVYASVSNEVHVRSLLLEEDLEGLFFVSPTINILENYFKVGRSNLVVRVEPWLIPQCRVFSFLSVGKLILKYTMVFW